MSAPRVRAVALAMAMAVWPAGEAAAQTSASGLDGAWRVDQVSSGGRVLTSPQPGLLLFTGRHYSYTLVTGDQPRPELPGGLVSAPDLLAVWNPFSANAGTFEVSGDRMVRRPVVAKNPDAMAPGAFNEYTFRLSADTLWVTSVGTETGPTRSPSTVRYVRAR